jgi:hypothetical protein
LTRRLWRALRAQVTSDSSALAEIRLRHLLMLSCSISLSHCFVKGPAVKRLRKTAAQHFRAASPLAGAALHQHKQMGPAISGQARTLACELNSRPLVAAAGSRCSRLTPSLHLIYT